MANQGQLSFQTEPRHTSPAGLCVRIVLTQFQGSDVRLDGPLRLVRQDTPYSIESFRWTIQLSDQLQLLYTSHNDVPADEGSIIDAGLGASNEASAPLQNVVPLSCFVRESTGTVIGDIIGRTWGRCCELQQLWVNPDYRRNWIGRRLVQEFHERAENRGCKTFYLETFSFQAPSLYRSLGYETRLELHGFSADVVKYVMVRDVHEPDSSGGRR